MLRSSRGLHTGYLIAQQVRASENILSLTRTLKEAWLFGKLHTVGASEAETRAEEAARKVAEMLGKIQEDRRNGQTSNEGTSKKTEGEEMVVDVEKRDLS